MEEMKVLKINDDDMLTQALSRTSLEFFPGRALVGCGRVCVRVLNMNIIKFKYEADETQLF